MRRLAWIVLLLLAAPAAGGITVAVDLGWNDLIRPGLAHPAAVTIKSTERRAVKLEWVVPQPNEPSLVLREQAVVNPGRQTFLMTLPLDVDAWATNLRIADAETDKTLVRWPAEPVRPNVFSVNLLLDVDPLAVVVGGELPTVQGATTTRMPPDLLPREAEAYAALDELILADINLTRLPVDVQAAIAERVRGGGQLTLWLSGDPVPSAIESPLASLMNDAGLGPLRRAVDDEGGGRWIIEGQPESDAPWHREVEQGSLRFFETAPVRLDAPPRVVVAAADTAGATEGSSDWPISLALVGLFLAGPVDWLALKQSGHSTRTAVGVAIGASTLLIAGLLFLI